MEIIINSIVGLVAFFYAYRYAFDKPMVVKVPWAKGWVYECNSNLSFLIYSILTAMLFLGPLSLVKYAVWIVILVLLMMRHRFSWRHNKILGAYTLFLLWNLYTMTYTPYPEQGWMMIVKFCLPYLYYWIGYNAIQSESDLFVFLEKTCKIMCVYALFLGGIISRFLPEIKALFTSDTGGLFISYASLADFFAIFFSIPFTMFLFTKEKRYIGMATWIFLSTLVDSVRTGIGASVLGMTCYYMVYKKSKAIPYICFMVLLFVGSIFAVPQVREKMFGNSATSVTVRTASMDKVVMNGRNFMWKRIMDHTYNGHEVIGSGSGAALGWLKEQVSKNGGLSLIHSDWVQMLSETGLVGLGLFIFFAIVMIIVVLSETWKFKNNDTVTFAGSMTVASFTACFFAMGFDNVITYSQQGYVLPFIILGIFYKVLDMSDLRY